MYASTAEEKGLLEREEIVDWEEEPWERLD